ncbi:MAG: cyclic nucleotide-binding domain-containing protein [Rectinemataceae bacterium]
MIAFAEKMQLVEPVRRIVSFRFLTDGELVDLLSVSDILRIEEGEIIVEEGGISPYFYGIVEGTVSITVHESKENKEVYINSLGPGDVFGEAGIFTRIRRTASVTALSSAAVLRIHRKDFVLFLKRHAEAGNKILLSIIFSLLRKLKLANEELAYERKSDISQDEIDTMVDNLFNEKDD